jgi:formylglycine-generating enzyme required for sulfatase activity
MSRLKSATLYPYLLPVFLSILMPGLSSCQGTPTTETKIKATQLIESIQKDPAGYLDQQSVLISAGDFLMGSNTARQDEKPAHLVYLDAFKIDIYEITNIQYQRFVQETGTKPPRYWSGGDFPPGQALFPVVGVRWKDAEAYCSWAGKRLPTEAEWEKACRGSEGIIYPWGNDPKDGAANGPQPEMWKQAWSYLAAGDANSSAPSLQSVGSYPDGTSPYGVSDLVGNASEWVADYYNWDGYWKVGRSNPLVMEPTWNHVVRGSAWLMPYGVSPGGIDLNRCSTRSSSHGDTRDARMGFRCADSPE